MLHSLYHQLHCSLHLCGLLKKTLCTFSLIKGLDPLPYPRRKVPFISPYWIFLNVSVLFNFALPFVFITGQQKESVDNRDNGTQSLSVSPWAMIRRHWRALPVQCSALFLHHGWHPDPPQMTRKHPWPLNVAKHWLKGQKQQVSVLVIKCSFFASEQRATGVYFQKVKYAASSAFEFIDSFEHVMVLECKACGYEIRKDHFQTNRWSLKVELVRHKSTCIWTPGASFTDSRASPGRSLVFTLVALPLNCQTLRAKNIKAGEHMYMAYARAMHGSQTISG